MVLVQENPDGQGHVIYYASNNLTDSETRYSCVEKLALAMVIAVQKFHHYILLRTTTVLADRNPMYYIMTHQVLGGKYSRWIVILQEFDLEFAKATLLRREIHMAWGTTTDNLTLEINPFQYE